jgi:hypothetical protein
MIFGLGLPLILAVFPASQMPAQTAQTSFSDSFHSKTLDLTHWIVGKLNVRGQAIPTEDGLKLTLSLRTIAPYFALTVWLNCRIRGDFDAQVSYRLVDWPPSNGIRLGIGVSPNTQNLPLTSTTLLGPTGRGGGLRTIISERISLKRGVDTSHPNGGEFYAAEMNGRESRLFPTANREGQLRVTREANEFTAWYWDRVGRLWIPTGQWTVNPDVIDDEWVGLQLWGFEKSPNITILLEDFSVSADELSCP